MSLEKEMLAVILKDLPNQTSGVLKTYLDQAEKDKEQLQAKDKEINDLYDRVKRYEESVKNLTKVNLELDSKIKSQETIEQVLKSTRRMEERIHISQMETELRLAKESNDKVMELARTVFRNPVFTESTTRSVPMQTTHTGNGYTNTNWENKTETVITTKEQI